jgi:hypothetical protein
VYETKHPQDDSISGLKRIEEIGNYRFFYDLWSIIKKKDGKVTKLLGRSFLKTVFADIHASIRERITLNTQSDHALDLELIISLFDEFALELFKESDSIYWAADFQAAIQVRSQLREQEAQLRMQDSVDSLAQLAGLK